MRLLMLPQILLYNGSHAHRQLVESSCKRQLMKRCCLISVTALCLKNHCAPICCGLLVGRKIETFVWPESRQKVCRSARDIFVDCQLKSQQLVRSGSIYYLYFLFATLESLLNVLIIDRTNFTMQNQPGNPFVYPKDVGVIAMDIYFPKTCVSQEELGRSDLVISTSIEPLGSSRTLIH